MPRFSYAELLSRPEDEGWELHDGTLVARSPAPTTRHQRVVGELHRQIANYLVDRPGEVFTAPFDVRLAAAGEPPEKVRTVVQPDLVVVCDSSRLDERGLQGGPDWVIEVLSPSTSARDQTTKLAFYEAHGVQHTWLVHPIDRVVTVYTYDEATGRYGRPAIHETKGRLCSGLFPELAIEWDRVLG